MKGTLHKSMNYGWMVQDGVDSFYPLHPYDIFTNSIERVEGKEVDFTLVYSWNLQEEKLIEVAIITDVSFKQETIYTEEQVIGFSKWATHIGFTYNSGDNCWYTEDVYKRTDEEMIYHYKECLKQNKTSKQ